MKNNKISVVGGAGHIGLPLSIVFANKGFDVAVIDKNLEAMEMAKKGIMPFKEKDGTKNLKKALKKKIKFYNKPSNFISNSTVVITVGTPVDNFLNPDMGQIKDCIDTLIPYLKKNQLIILRSTVYPGTSSWLYKYLLKKKKCDIAFCHERVIQGYTFDEIEKLPQIIAANSKKAEKRATDIFSKISKKIVYSSLKEAEFSKLFSNAFRYTQFAIANEFYMLADKAGLDFNKIRKITKDGYPRAESMPSAGFAAGPCLLKDTMQLLSFSKNNFSLGNSSMLVNEGLVLYLIDKLEKKYNLKTKKVGLLGMAFKAESDDTRSSLSYKMKKFLSTKVKKIICTDPFVKTDKNLSSLENTIKESDILILCVPHKKYKKLNIKNKEVIDIWGYI
jgi:UDP-N-acetyl-D-mannosaminuronic acid dehydrogenase|tara:strand:+ start:769 stop:1938 length:1170 start_codon:yes stop_codon:yes gene_type:complete